jgi:NifU-like protein involved in Fe-S cluster formation
MTAPCRQACCNATPRRSVSDLFERGFRRNRLPPLTIVGATCTGADDNAVSFSLEVKDGRIATVGFRASCCATLIAYCEYIAELAPHLALDLAHELTTADLIEGLPGVPALKRDRAVLAIAGFRAAVLAATESRTGETTNESRIYLRHAAQ